MYDCVISPCLNLPSPAMVRLRIVSCSLIIYWVCAVLDSSIGKPAEGVQVTLQVLEASPTGDAFRSIAQGYIDRILVGYAIWKLHPEWLIRMADVSAYCRLVVQTRQRRLRQICKPDRRTRWTSKQSSTLKKQIGCLSIPGSKYVQLFSQNRHWSSILQQDLV